MVERFYLGLARRGVEIDFKEYQRQPVALRFVDGCLSNAEGVKFSEARSTWGIIDGFTLSNGLTDPVIAKSPLTIPTVCGAGTSFWFGPGSIAMNAKSFETLFGRKPFLIAS